MIPGPKRLPRRTFLRGLGTTVALPLLDAMIPAFARAEKLFEESVPDGVRVRSERHRHGFVDPQNGG